MKESAKGRFFENSPHYLQHARYGKSFFACIFFQSQYQNKKKIIEDFFLFFQKTSKVIQTETISFKTCFGLCKLFYIGHGSFGGSTLYENIRLVGSLVLDIPHAPGLTIALVGKHFVCSDYHDSCFPNTRHSLKGEFLQECSKVDSLVTSVMGSPGTFHSKAFLGFWQSSAI